MPGFLGPRPSSAVGWGAGTDEPGTMCLISWRGNLVHLGFLQSIANYLILLCHKFFCRDRLPIGAAQHGHRDRVVASVKINLLRIVAIEFGTWRSVRSGGASRSVTVGNGKFLEQSGGTRS